MTPAIDALLDRLRRLADALSDVRARVRAAVAAEVAALLGAAVRDAILFAAHPECALRPPDPAGPAAWRDDVDPDDADPWDDPDPDPGVRPGRPGTGSRPARRAGWFALTLAAAASAARWWRTLGGRGGPLVRAAGAALAAAADLLALAV